MALTKSRIQCGDADSLPLCNTHDFLFSNPYQKANDFTPQCRVVPPVSPNTPIFVDDASDRTLSFGRLRSDSLLVAHNLIELKSPHPLDPSVTLSLPPTATCPHNPHIAPIVLIQLPNCLALTTLVLGTLAADLTASLISPGLKAPEIAWILQNVRPSLIITATTCLPAVQEALGAQKDKDWFPGVDVLTVNLTDDTYPQSDPNPADNDWGVLLQPRSATGKPDRDFSKLNYRSDERAALILWSSGTSGRPKGVLLSHHALNFCVTSIWNDTDFYSPRKQERWLGFVPFFHVFGISNLFLVAVATGSTVYLQQSFSPTTFLDAIQRRKITYLHMAPPVAALLAKSPLVDPYLRRGANGNHGLSSVVGAVSGGAPLGLEIVLQVYRRLGFRVRRGYGLTEASGGVTMQKELAMTGANAEAGDLGSAHWGVQVMIASESKSSPAPTGVTGEILVKSPGLLMGYLPYASSSPSENPAATTDSITPDGWFRTGDVGFITGTSRLVFSDRIKEIIKVKGFQVAPAELEAILCSDEAVSDAGVVAVWDQDAQTEWPRAFVALAAEKGGSVQVPGIAARLKKLVESQTTNYKWLRGGIVFVDAVPRSPSGKILRRLLKDGAVNGVKVDVYEKRRAKL